MTRIWNSRQDVKHAAVVLGVIWRADGSLPSDLVEAYKEILATASKGLIAHFYECLATEAPGAIKLFVRDRT